MSRSSEYLTLLDNENKHVLSNLITDKGARPHTHAHTHTQTQTQLINQAENVLCVWDDFMLCFIYET